MAFDASVWTLDFSVNAVESALARLSSERDANFVESASVAGLSWYHEGHAFVLDMARLAEMSPVKVAGITAAFSVRTSWRLNLVNTHLFLAGFTPGTTKTNLDKARRIANLPESATYDDVAAILNGPKIKAFAHNLLHPDTSDKVTIDVWMARALGIEQSVLNNAAERANRKLGTAKVTLYERLQDAFRVVAERHGMSPLQLQAILWVLVRGKAD